MASVRLFITVQGPPVRGTQGSMKSHVCGMWNITRQQQQRGRHTPDRTRAHTHSRHAQAHTGKIPRKTVVMEV